MAENEKPVGYRFHPTDSELIYHLKNKIRGDSCEAINEININDYDPASLRSLSKIQSNDPTWYFFARAVYTNTKKNARKRITRSGLWKPTGNDREIKDKNGKKIGLKKTLVYHERGAATKSVKKKKKETLAYHELGASKTVKKKTKKKKNPWVMHEYHIQCWSHPEMESYVICKIKYKGEENGDIASGSGSEPSQSLVSDSTITNTQLQIEQPCDEENGLSIDDLAIPIMNEQVEELDPFFDGLSENDFAIPIMNEQDEDFDPKTFFDGLPENDLVMPMNEPEPEQEVPWDDDDPNSWFTMQEDCNDYQPRKPLTGIIVDYSSDDNDDSEEDAESISVTSYQGSLSPGDSVCSSSNKHFPSCRDETLSSSTDSCKDLQDSSGDSSITRENTETQLADQTVGSKQEVKTEKKKGLFLGEEAMEKTTHKNNPKYVYIMEMIIGFILLVALIGSNIVSV